MTCEMIECPAPYMGKDALQPNAPPDKSLPAQDPFGTGMVSIVFSFTFVGLSVKNIFVWIRRFARTKVQYFVISIRFKVSKIIHFIFSVGGVSYVEYGMCPRDRPFAGERDVVRTLSYNKLHAFDHSTHGQFFWNFRTEFETRWDYQRVSCRVFKFFAG